jgi:N-acetylmuramoyl-L-alanine amidase
VRAEAERIYFEGENTMKNVKSGHSCPVVCLDAGHYGKYNQSPAVKAYYESEAMWDLHLLLKTALEAYGIKVTTTRANQAKDMDLYDRGAASKGADLFLSLHSNAAGSTVNESVDYVRVYHLYEDNGTDVDDKSKALAKLLAPVIAKTMGTKQAGQIASRKASSDKNGDGVLNDNYYGVLNGARQVGTPSLILEHSFHTNTRSTKWLMVEANLKKLAEVEAQIIAEYFGVEKAVKPAEDKTYTLTLRQLRKGCKGADVKALQQLLIANGYSCGPDGADGDFGTNTREALISYQTVHSLAGDGIAGPATMTSLLGAK